MNNNDHTLTGALTGAAIAAAVGFARTDDETQRRLRHARTDATAALHQIRDFESRGEVLRLEMPVVQDCIAGLSIANQGTPVPSLTPSAVAQVRPDLAANMQVAVEDMQWPPKPGQYDERGLIIQVGELTALFTALTYEECRAFLQGLTQSKQPSDVQKVQTYFAANSLISVLYGLNLTWQQYADAWKRMFTGMTAGGGSAADPHHLTSQPPTITSTDPGITSVVPLGAPELAGYPLAHANTDAANKWRITVASGGALAGVQLFSVAFGSSYFRMGASGQPVPYQPVVLSQNGMLYAATVTPAGFTVKALFGLAGGSVLDVGFATVVGSS